MSNRFKHMLEGGVSTSTKMLYASATLSPGLVARAVDGIDMHRRVGFELAKVLDSLEEAPESLRDEIGELLRQDGMTEEKVQETLRYVLSPFPLFSLMTQRAEEMHCPISVPLCLRKRQEYFDDITDELRRAPFKILLQQESLPEHFRSHRPWQEVTSESQAVVKDLFAHRGLWQQLQDSSAETTEDAILASKTSGTPWNALRERITTEVHYRFPDLNKSCCYQIADGAIEYIQPQLKHVFKDGHINPEMQRFMAELIAAFVQLTDIAIQVRTHKFPSQNALLEFECKQLDAFRDGVRKVNEELRGYAKTPYAVPDVRNSFLNGAATTDFLYHTPIVFLEHQFPRLPDSNKKLLMGSMCFADVTMTYGFGAVDNNGWGLDFTSLIVPQVRPDRLKLLGLGTFSVESEFAELERKAFQALSDGKSVSELEQIKRKEAIYKSFATYANHDFVHVAFLPTYYNPNAAWNLSGYENVYRSEIAERVKSHERHEDISRQLCAALNLDVAHNNASSVFLQYIQDDRNLRKALGTKAVRAFLSEPLVAYVHEWAEKLDTDYFERQRLRVKRYDPRRHIARNKENAYVDGRVAGVEMLSMLYRTAIFHKDLGWDPKLKLDSPDLDQKKAKAYQQDIYDYLDFVRERQAAMEKSDPLKEQAAKLSGYALTEFFRRALFVLPPEIIKPAVEKFADDHPDFIVSIIETSQDMVQQAHQQSPLEVFDGFSSSWQSKLHDITHLNIFKDGKKIGEEPILKIVAEYEASKLPISAKQAVNAFLGLNYEPIFPNNAIVPYGILDKLKDAIWPPLTAKRLLGGAERRAIVKSFDSARPLLKAVDAAIFTGDSGHLPNAVSVKKGFSDLRGAITGAFALDKKGHLAKPPYELNEQFVLQRLDAIEQFVSYMLNVEIQTGTSQPTSRLRAPEPYTETRHR